MSLQNIDTARQHKRQQYIANSPWAGAEVQALAVDASFRSYYRLVLDGRSALLMDAPPEHEDILPFLKVDEHLLSLGLRAPRIESYDLKQGFALLEDFGHDTFTRLLKAGADEKSLYRLGCECIMALQSHPQNSQLDIPAYDEAVLQREAALLIDWFYPALTGSPCPIEACEAYTAAWKSCFAKLGDLEPCIVLRDFHVDNLMLVNAQDGQECGLLDFQDALLGSPAYDLMSLLEDARRDVDESLQQELLAIYLQGFTQQAKAAYICEYRILAAQRHAKVAGIFVRLKMRDGKGVYIEHIPRVIRLLAKNLQYPELAELKLWFDTYLPNYQQALEL